MSLRVLIQVWYFVITRTSANSKGDSVLCVMLFLMLRSGRYKKKCNQNQIQDFTFGEFILKGVSK